MRRMLLVLTVTALMATMMVSAGPAKADVSISSGGGSSFGGGNSSNFSSGGSFISVGGVVDDVDFGGIGFVGGGIDLDID